MKTRHSQIFYTFFLLGLFNSLAVLTQDKPVWAYNGLSEFNAGRFIENKGQLRDDLGNKLSDVRFYLSSGNATVYVSNSSLHFTFSKTLTGDSPLNSENISEIEINKVSLELLGSNKKAKIEFFEPTDDFYNFYYSHCPNGITNVKSYRKAVIRNVYDNIDMVLYANGNRFGFKYDFIVRKGGKPDDIKLRYSSGRTEKTDNETVSMIHDKFRIDDNSPVTYQKKSGKNNRIESSLSVNDDIISFNIGDYNKNRDLIIDPEITWATYYGGSDGDHSGSIALDFQSNAIIAGKTQSKNFPVTNSTTLKGVYDLLVVKFDYTGKRLWSTLYGGKEEDFIGAVAVDSAGHIYVTGWTWDAGFPVSANCFQPTKKGGQNEGFLIKLLRDGTRDWATYVGGSGDEHLYSVATNGSFDITLAGWSKSDNFPNDSVPINPKKFGDDIVLTQFKNDGTYKWSTFLGGDSLDGANCVVYDNLDILQLTGVTHSNNFKTTANAKQLYYAGDGDAFISKFTNTGQLIYSSYFGGSRKDVGNAITCDALNNTIITGHTFSKDFPVTTNAWQKTNKGLINAFIAKFDNANQLSWSSYLGGKTEDYSYSVATDRNNNIIIGGHASSSDFPVTKNALQKSLKGPTDAFGAKLTPDGITPFWITLIGGDDEDLCKDLSIDFYQNIYFTGDTKSKDFPVTLTAQQKSLAGQFDCYVYKHCATSPFTDIKVSGKTSFCEGESVELDAGSGFIFYEWSGGETSQKIKVSQSGSYSVRVTDTMYCDFSSAAVLINVLPKPSVKIQGNPKFCEGDSAVLSVPNNYTIWKWSTGQTARTISLKTNLRIILSVTDANGCTGFDTVLVEKSQRPKPLIHGPKTVCAFSTNVTYNVYGIAGHSYEWIIEGGDIRAGGDYFNVQVDWKAIGKAKIKLIQTDNTTGCIGIDSMEVKISDHLEPQITTTTGKYLFCEIDTIEIDAGMGYLSYKWNTGETTQKLKITSPGKYHVAVIGEGNCKGYDTVEIKIHPAPEPIITGDTTLCINSGIHTYAVDFYDDHLYDWKITNGTIVSGANTNTITVNWSGTGVGTLSLTETDTLTKCEVITNDFLVSVNSLPLAIITPSSKTEFCEGDSTYLTAMAGGTSYIWSTGDTVRTITAKNAGLYVVQVFNEFGCESSDSIKITVLPRPAKPFITQIDDTLISTQGLVYEWYRDGYRIAGADSSTLVTQTDGEYKVVHRNSEGCTSESDVYKYKYVPLIGYAWISTSDTIFVKTGDAVVIPIRIDSSKTLPKVRAGKYLAEVSFDGSVLAVDNHELPFTKNGQRKTLQITGEKKDTTGLMFNLYLHAALGDSVCTNVTIDTISWDKSNVVSFYKNCVVCLTNVCEEGGTRLYLSDGLLELKQNTPNPADDRTEVEFTSIESGNHTLSISDVFGISRKLIFRGNLTPGTHRLEINTAELSSGTYFYYLETPTRMLKGKMQVVK